MANNYTLQFIVPDTDTFDTQRTYIDFWQIGSGVGGYLGTGFLSLLESYFDALCQTHQGVYSTTSVQQGNNTIYTVSLTLNQDMNLLGEYVTVAFFSDEGGSVAGFQISSPSVDTTPCDICYDITSDPCADEIYLPGLDADATYTLTFTDNNSQVNYTYTVVTDGSGEATIVIADFPVGAFSNYSNYTVTILDENGDPAQVTIGYTTYDCYNLVFTPSTNVTPEG